MMQMMLQINNPVHYNQANFPKYLEIRITKIGRAVYLTQIRILSNLNHQYHNQINQRPVAQRILNMSMLILRIQHLLLMTPPGLHTSHLISNYWSEKLTRYFIFVFVTLFVLSLYGCEQFIEVGRMEMIDFSLQQSCYLVNSFVD